jgi:hypothetical protein
VGKGMFSSEEWYSENQSISLMMRGAYGLWRLQQIFFSVWVLLKSCNWATHYGVLYCSPLIIRVGVAKCPMAFTTCVTPLAPLLCQKVQATSMAFKEDFWHGHLEQLWTSMCQLHWPRRCTITSN